MIDCDSLCLEAAVELFAPRGLHGEVRPNRFLQLERVIHERCSDVGRLRSERIEHLLFHSCQRVGTHDNVGGDRSATIYDATGVRFEGGPRTTSRIGLERIGHHFHKLAAREKLALLLDGAAVRGVPFGRRHLEGVTAFQREYRLHETLSEGSCADNQSTVVILESTGDDLRSRSASSIREKDEWNRRCDRVIGGVESLVLTIAGADAGDLESLLEEEIADAQRLIQDPTGIPAQIDDDSLCPGARQLGDCALELVSRALVELEKRDIAYSALQHD